jgi:hypothetical protein
MSKGRFLVRFTLNFNLPDMFEKYSSTNFREIPSVPTDRHDEANSRFSQLDAPNKEPFFFIYF